MDEGIDSGTASASDCGDEEEKLRAYKSAVPTFLSSVTNALALANEDEDKNVNHKSARDFVMYLVNLFLDKQKQLKQANTKKALCILKETNPETDSVAEETITKRDISMVCQAIVSALFDGDQASIQHVATDATKAYEFMLNKMPEDPVSPFFVLDAYDVSLPLLLLLLLLRLLGSELRSHDRCHHRQQEAKMSLLLPLPLLLLLHVPSPKLHRQPKQQPIRINSSESRTRVLIMNKSSIVFIQIQSHQVHNKQ